MNVNMKSQKGITLISLTVYIIVMTIVVGTVSLISSHFYTNIRDSVNTVEPLTQYTKLNSFITEEINRPNIKVLECKTTYIDNDQTKGIETSYIVFDNGTQYTFISKNQGIYRNKVKIAEQIKSCSFTQNIENAKTKITINVKAEKKNFNKTQDYIIKN